MIKDPAGPGAAPMAILCKDVTLPDDFQTKYKKVYLEGNYLFSGVVSVTLNFHPQGRNVNDVTNEGKS